MDWTGRNLVRHKYILTGMTAVVMLFFLLTAGNGRAENISCSICGKKISGGYYRVGNRSYCGDCMARYPQCHCCGHPSDKSLKIEGKPVCPGCASGLEKCEICGSAMLKRFVHKNNRGDKDMVICEKCNKNRRNCYNCGMPVKNTDKPVEGRRCLCIRCKKRIAPASEYHKIYGEVRKDFRKFGLNVKKTYPLNIVSLENLENRKTSKVADPFGHFNGKMTVTKDNKGKIIKRETEGGILILSCLDRGTVYDVLSHEYAHAWHFEQKQDIRDSEPEDEEGFAEWVSYHLLKKRGMNAIAEAKLQKPAPYGSGLKRMLNIEKSGRMQGVIEYIKKR